MTAECRGVTFPRRKKSDYFMWKWVDVLGSGHLVSRAATSRAVERQDVDRGKPDIKELPDRLFSLLESRSSLTEWPSTGRAKREVQR